jgi:hypothetical protein
MLVRALMVVEVVAGGFRPCFPAPPDATMDSRSVSRPDC